ncbi:CAP domain-containing protein [Actinoplanes nipponensis]|nr:CAP domain-containing protein [Actinoplanes nipponensis]
MPAAQKFQYTLVAGATAVVIGVGFTVVGFHRQAAPPATRTAADVPLVAAAPTGDPGAGTDLLDDAPLPGPASSSAGAPSSTPVSKAPTAAPKKPKASPTPRRTTAPAPRPKPKKAPVTSGSVLDRVLDHINAARAGEGLAALTLDPALSKASALHNQRMIDGCGLAHECSGEGGIGTRFSAQGVQWRSAGENIGFGFAADSDDAVVKAADGLCDSMLAEVPPEDGHRRNLLSKDFRRIGLSVVRESSGKVWLTQDFVG